MCRINLKKIEAKGSQVPKQQPQPQPQQSDFKEEVSQVAPFLSLEQLASQPGQPLFDEFLFNLNPSLLTPLGLPLSNDYFPFPAESEQVSSSVASGNNPSSHQQPPYHDLLTSHSYALEPQPPQEACYSSSPEAASMGTGHSSPVCSSSYSPVPASPANKSVSLEGSPSPFALESTPTPQEATKKKAIRNPLISESKRERNRLAAEKYRKKGRELVTTLEKRCNDLSKENSDLRHRNMALEEEMQYLRSLLGQRGLVHQHAQPLQSAFCS